MANKKNDKPYFTFTNKKLYDLAKEGQKNRNFERGVATERAKAAYNRKASTVNNAIDEYKKNGSISDKTAASLSRYNKSRYHTGDAYADVSNPHSAYNTLSRESFRQYSRGDASANGVASQLLNNYNDKKEFENYNRSRSDRERQAYREKRIAQAE